MKFVLKLIQFSQIRNFKAKFKISLITSSARHCNLHCIHYIVYIYIVCKFKKITEVKLLVKLKSKLLHSHER